VFLLRREIRRGTGKWSEIQGGNQVSGRGGYGHKKLFRNQSGGKAPWQGGLMCGTFWLKEHVKEAETNSVNSGSPADGMRD